MQQEAEVPLSHIIILQGEFYTEQFILLGASAAILFYFCPRIVSICPFLH